MYRYKCIHAYIFIYIHMHVCIHIVHIVFTSICIYKYANTIHIDSISNVTHGRGGEFPDDLTRRPQHDGGVW